MPSVDFVKKVEVKRTARLIQLEGMFDVPASSVSEFPFKAEIPIEYKGWKIGLIVGASGSGKTTLANHLWPDHTKVSGKKWDANLCVADGFPKQMSIKEVTTVMSSVGFSSPPAWRRPYGCLSNGEQFRVSLAHALVSGANPVVYDEFTSVVDRTVAKVASAAVAKYVRRQENVQFVAVTCHHDVEEWLQPDWVFNTDTREFTRRLLQKRPTIQLEVKRATSREWNIFRHHHYLSETLAASSKCYVGYVWGRPAAFTAVVSYPHPITPSWREHRTVCLPDFQGVGIGNAMSEFIASLYAATGKPYRSITGHPGMIAHRSRSPFWRLVREPGLMQGGKAGKSLRGYTGTSLKRFEEARASQRYTASFKYVGPIRWDEARLFGVIDTNDKQCPIQYGTGGSIRNDLQGKIKPTGSEYGSFNKNDRRKKVQDKPTTRMGVPFAYKGTPPAKLRKPPPKSPPGLDLFS